MTLWSAVSPVAMFLSSFLVFFNSEWVVNLEELYKLLKVLVVTFYVPWVNTHMLLRPGACECVLSGTVEHHCTGLQHEQ